MRARASSAVVGFLVLACASAANAQSSTAAKDSILPVRSFVQGFYDWYTPIAVADHKLPAWWSVLRNADRYLEPELADLIRGDSAARVANATTLTREVLNFDPFLASQDPCGPNEVIDVRREGATFKVPIRQCSSSPAREAGMVVEVRGVDGRLRIANVIYDTGNLKSYLCKWANADRRADKRPAKYTNC